MSTIHVAAAALLLLTAGEPAATPTQILAPEAEPAVSALLKVSTPIGKGLRVDASIQKDRVLVMAGEESARSLAVMLLHASQAVDGDTVIGDLALRPKPGPAPKDLVAAIAKRVKAGGGKLPWVTLEPDPEPKPEPKPAKAGADVAAIAEQLSATRYRLSTDETDMAKTFLKSVPAALNGPASVEVALLWRRLGDAAQAKTVLEAAGELPPMLAAAKALILDDALPTDLAKVDADRRCGYAQLASMAFDLGHADKAVALLTLIQEASPTCVEAFGEHIQLLIESGRAAEAGDLTKTALERFSGDSRILSSAAAVHIAAGELAKAIPLLEKATRLDLKRRNPLRVLLGAVVRDPTLRAEQAKALAERLKTTPDDVVTKFLLGVIHHYENDFDASNALLAPLEAELDHSDRLHIYRAMNDFNLGKAADALARLKRAATRPDPDPDIYYCLAEIQRDTDRKAARADLTRYAAISKNNPLSNPGKEERVQRMLTLLDACLADGRVTCEGEWEHPRLRKEKEDLYVDLKKNIGAAIALLLIVMGVMWWRRRKSAGSEAA
jgi:tetratricopeptide (TPR) repeat protein